MAIDLAERNDALIPAMDEPSGLRERQRVARGGAILEAAFALMVEQGYDALTMEAVAARVGISRQTLYHHFKSRDEIVLRALLILTDESMAMIRSLDLSLPPVERLKRIARWMIESKAEPVRAALVKVKQSLTAVLSHPDYLAAFERRALMLAEIVGAAQVSGEVRADLQPRLIVQMLNLVLSACGDGTSPEVTNAMIDVFFTGLRAQS